ncbi:hypothetical protein PO124_05700 [Bacillus licheniformis]|nr:hypothetical protein [Bacillus licheniformis]
MKGDPAYLFLSSLLYDVGGLDLMRKIGPKNKCGKESEKVEKRFALLTTFTMLCHWRRQQLLRLKTEMRTTDKRCQCCSCA